MEDTKKSHLPPSFLSAMKRLLGDEADELLASISEEKVTSVRYNPIKNVAIKPGDLIPWCPHGRYLHHRPSFTLDPAFHAGLYYVQEASSMLLYEVLSQSVKIPEPRVLDLCGAPGGKATLILDFIGQDGYLITNEVIKSRANILADNIKKWAHTNAIVTTNDALDFQRNEYRFDVINIDAPCSGEGMFRKSENAVNDWSEDNVNLCSSRQRRIVADILPCLDDGGILIYSTCTFNDAENINNIKWMCEQFGLSSLQLTFAAEWQISEKENSGHFGYQCFPHKTKGEGFFIAAVQKKGIRQEEKINKQSLKKGLRFPDKKETELLEKWINIPSDHLLMMTDKYQVYLLPNIMAPQVVNCINNLRLVHSGIKCGKLERDVFIPDQNLAYSSYVHENIPRIEMDKDIAISYLKKELQSITSAKKGWMLATYEGYGLGWLKNLGNRINNYYPNELVIKKK